MDYKPPTIEIELIISGFQQHTPSKVNTTWNYKYGEKGKRETLTKFERIEFLKMAIDSLVNLVEHEALKEK